MDRTTGESVRNLTNAIRTDIRSAQTSLQHAASQAGELDLALTNTAGLVDELCERIRYLGWSTDAILDYFSDGQWRTRSEVEEALRQSGAPLPQHGQPVENAHPRRKNWNTDESTGRIAGTRSASGGCLWIERQFPGFGRESRPPGSHNQDGQERGLYTGVDD